MDPLSIMGGVAGVATAGVAISSALYDLIASIRDAPIEMIEIARGVHDLSTVLRELRRVLKKAYKILRDRLLKAVKSVMDRIRDTQDEVDRLLDVEGGLSRIFWAFRKSRANKLMATIEGHKSTVQLMATTVTLALVQRQQTEKKTENVSRGDEKAILRTQAETLVQVTEQSLQALVPMHMQSDKCTQTEDPAAGLHEPLQTQIAESALSLHPAKATAASQPTDTRLERWVRSPEDTAAWLYRLVFQDDQVVPSSHRKSSDITLIDVVPDLLVPRNRAPKAPVLNRLLLQWTYLSPVEIDETSITMRENNGNPHSRYAKDISRRVELLSGRHSMPELPFYHGRRAESSSREGHPAPKAPVNPENQSNIGNDDETTGFNGTEFTKSNRTSGKTRRPSKAAGRATGSGTTIQVDPPRQMSYHSFHVPPPSQSNNNESSYSVPPAAPANRPPLEASSKPERRHRGSMDKHDDSKPYYPTGHRDDFAYDAGAPDTPHAVEPPVYYSAPGDVYHGSTLRGDLGGSRISAAETAPSYIPMVHEQAYGDHNFETVEPRPAPVFGENSLHVHQTQESRPDATDLFEAFFGPRKDGNNQGQYLSPDVYELVRALASHAANVNGNSHAQNPPTNAKDRIHAWMYGPKKDSGFNTSYNHQAQNQTYPAIQALLGANWDDKFDNSYNNQAPNPPTNASDRIQAWLYGPKGDSNVSGNLHDTWAQNPLPNAHVPFHEYFGLKKGDKFQATVEEDDTSENTGSFPK